MKRAVTLSVACLLIGNLQAPVCAAVMSLPSSGIESIRAADGQSLGIVDWGRKRAVSQGAAYVRPYAGVESYEYGEAARRARRFAQSRLKILLFRTARLHKVPLDEGAVTRAADQAPIVDGDFDAVSGQLTLTVEVSLSGKGAALSAEAPPHTMYNPYRQEDGHTSSGPTPAVGAVPSLETNPPPPAEPLPAVVVSAPLAPAVPDLPPQPEEPAARPGSLTIPRKGLLTTPAGQEGPFTGVVIDCRGLDLVSSMSPKLRTANGKEVWGTVKVSSDFAVAVGIAGFMVEWDRALAYEQRVGAHPMIIRAVGCGGGRSHSDAILADSDAAWLLKEDDRAHFLSKFHVMFVVDPLRE